MRRVRTKWKETQRIVSCEVPNVARNVIQRGFLARGMLALRKPSPMNTVGQGDWLMASTDLGLFNTYFSDRLQHYATATGIEHNARSTSQRSGLVDRKQWVVGPSLNSNSYIFNK